MKNKKDIIKILVVVFLTGFALFRSFTHFQGRDLWKDEYRQINPMGESLSAALADAREKHQFPGDYLLIYPFYKIFQKNKWGLAIPHILINVLGYFLLYRIGTLYLKTALGYGLALLIIAFNYNLNFHAFEIRPYPVLWTLGLASFLVTHKMIREKAPSIKTKIAISAFIFMTISYHIFGALMLLCCYLYHLLDSRKGTSAREIFSQNIKNYIWGVLLSFPVFYHFAVTTEKTYTYETFKFISQGFIPIAKGIVGNLIGFRPLYVLLLGLLLGFLIPHRDRQRQAVFLLTLVILPVGLTLLICIINHYWFIQRLFVWVMPLFALLLGWQWESVVDVLSGIKRREIFLKS